jgi:DNA invertase Pin-like site-specific DNA recombinase
MVGYVRVSTEEQASSGLGLEAQRKAIRQAAEHRGWTLGRIHEDAGLSGKSLERPGLEAALSDVSTGKADGLVVAKLDRLSRSLLDFASLMERSRRERWALVALDLALDTSTPQGELMCAVLASFAQFERRLIGERTKAGLAVKRSQGVKLGRERTIPDDVYRRILAMRDDGLSFRTIAAQFNVEGVPAGQGGQWYGSTVQQAIRTREADTQDPIPQRAANGGHDQKAST